MEQAGQPTRDFPSASEGAAPVADAPAHSPASAFVGVSLPTGRLPNAGEGLLHANTATQSLAETAPAICNTPPPHLQAAAPGASAASNQQPPPLEEASAKERAAASTGAGSGHQPPLRHAAGSDEAAAAAAVATPPPAPEGPPLDLPELRQMFFDQPTSPPELRQRLKELEEVRHRSVFPDKGALWDGMLAHLRRYLHLLEQQAGSEGEQGQPEAMDMDAGTLIVEGQHSEGQQLDAVAVELVCDLCRKPPVEGSHLQRMQRIGRPEHKAVCGRCAGQLLGQLMPLTVTWQPDMGGWTAIQAALRARQPMQRRAVSMKVARPAHASRPASACSNGGHRGKAKFQATSRAWLKELTRGNLEPSNGPKPRVYLPFGVYWFWVDQLLGQAAEQGCPRVLRLRQADSVAAAASVAAEGPATGGGSVAAVAAKGASSDVPTWDVRLLHTDDGMQLQPTALRAVLEHLHAGVDSRLLIVLEEQHCNNQHLQATVKRLDKNEPLPQLPGLPVSAPRSLAAAAGLANSKKRKGGQSRQSGEGSAGEVYAWDENWDEEETDDNAMHSLAVQSLDGPSGVGRSKRRGAGGRLASILRQEQPQSDDDSEDGDFMVAEQADGNWQEGPQVALPEDTGELPFQPQCTASVEEAMLLAADLEPNAEVAGAPPPRPGVAQKWGVYVKCPGHRSRPWYGRLDQQRAAVVADLVLLWQQETQPDAAAEGEQPRGRHKRSLQELLEGDGYGYDSEDDAEPSSSGDSMADEVQAMKAAAALATTAGSGESSCRSGSVGGADGGRLAPGAGHGSEVVPTLNLPGALYREDEELMQQIRQIRTPQQMVSFLSVIVPQDPLPGQRGAPLAGAHSQEQQRLQQQAQQAQERENQSQGLPRKQQELKAEDGSQQQDQERQKTRRKRKGPAAVQQQRAQGRPPLPQPQQPQSEVPGQRRRVGVVFYHDERRWAAAAAGRNAAGQLVPLRTEGLSAAEQAEVARDLLAVWGWLSEGGVVPKDQDDKNRVAGLEQQENTSRSIGAGLGTNGPPLPPLNHPLSFYSKWATDLQQLGVGEVESYVKVVAEEVCEELLATLPSPADPATTPAAAQSPPAGAGPALQPSTVAPLVAERPGIKAEPAPANGPVLPAAAAVQGDAKARAATNAAADGAASTLDWLGVLASAADGLPRQAAAGVSPSLQPPPAPDGSFGRQTGQSLVPLQQQRRRRKRPAVKRVEPADQEDAGVNPMPPQPQREAPTYQQQRQRQPLEQQQKQQQQPADALQPAPVPAFAGSAPTQLLPTAAAGGGSGSLIGAGSGSLPGAGPALADRAAQARQRKVQQALEALAAAATDNPDSMLRPLRLLVLANKGGSTLRDVVQSWTSYELTVQQDIFDAALIAADYGQWEELEEQLLFALS